MYERNINIFVFEAPCWIDEFPYSDEKLLHLVPETTYEIIHNNGEKDNHERPIRITSKDIRSYPDV